MILPQLDQIMHGRIGEAIDHTSPQDFIPESNGVHLSIPSSKHIPSTLLCTDTVTF